MRRPTRVGADDHSFPSIDSGRGRSPEPRRSPPTAGRSSFVQHCRLGSYLSECPLTEIMCRVDHFAYVIVVSVLSAVLLPHLHSVSVLSVECNDRGGVGGRAGARLAAALGLPTESGRPAAHSSPPRTGSLFAPPAS